MYLIPDPARARARCLRPSHPTHYLSPNHRLTYRFGLAIGLMLLFSAINVKAQYSTALGKVNEFEANVKECAFDPEAVAVILVDEAVSDYNEDYNLVTYRHTKIKILKEPGIQEYGNFKIDYRSEKAYENIDAFEAVVSNADESGRFSAAHLDKKSVYKNEVNEDVTRLSVAFPNVRVGSIIDFKYRRFSKHYGFLRDWYFQHRLPVYQSRFELKMVPNLEISYLLQYDKRFRLDVKPKKITNSITFEMREVPSLTDEPFMDAREDYLQKVMFQITKYSTGYGAQNYMSNWNELTRELLDRQDFGRQIRLKIDECQDYVASLSGKPEFDRMRAIHQYVIGNTEWNGTYGVVSDGVRTLWKKRAGSSADINLLLVNLLQHAGLEAYPMLVSERGNGKINKSSPFIDQFNNVYAAVYINDKKYYLDATDRFTPSHEIPFSILNTTAYIVNNRNGGLLDISEMNGKQRDAIVVQARLSDDGECSGRVLLSNKEYSRSDVLPKYKRLGQEKYINDYVIRDYANVTIDSFTVQNPENDSMALNQTFRYKMQVQTTGEYSFVSLNMFTGMEKNPFILKDRFSNINFGCNKALSLSCSIYLPNTIKVDALPSNIKLRTPDGNVQFIREIFYDEAKGILVARMKVDVNKSLFPVDEYPFLREFYRQMIDMMNEQVVLKKNS